MERIAIYSWQVKSFVHLSETSRPREKLLRLGARALTESELWSCVLGLGTRRVSVTTLARSVVGIERRALREQKALLGKMGQAQRCRIEAILELWSRETLRKRVRLRSPEDVWLQCQDLVGAGKEMIKALYCNTVAEVIHAEVLALGGLNIALLQPKELFFPIRLLPVDSVVLCHNHPSGNLDPSPEDKVFTKRIAAACELMGLALRDHLIVAKTGYVSLRERGILET